VAAVAIAAGLVFISRSLSSQLRALARVQEAAVLLALAERTVRQIESASPRVANPAPKVPLAGVYAPPFEAYEWEMVARPDEASTGDGMPKSVVRVSVYRTDGAVAPVRLTMVWPAAWTDSWR
jgi:hypothetical protein